MTKRAVGYSPTQTRLYGIWHKMKDRCANPCNKSYINYGGRGIAVCDEWRNEFKTFEDWAYANGYREYLTIDRIDNNGNYEPTNCRWATMIEQNNNKRCKSGGKGKPPKQITIGNETHTFKEWGKITGINFKTIKTRYYDFDKRGFDLIAPLKIKKIPNNRNQINKN